jgi:hypothetical protein
MQKIFVYRIRTFSIREKMKTIKMKNCFSFFVILIKMERSIMKENEDIDPVLNFLSKTNSKQR